MDLLSFLNFKHNNNNNKENTTMTTMTRQTTSSKLNADSKKKKRAALENITNNPHDQSKQQNKKNKKAKLLPGLKKDKSKKDKSKRQSISNRRRSSLLKKTPLPSSSRMGKMETGLTPHLASMDVASSSEAIPFESIDLSSDQDTLGPSSDLDTLDTSNSMDLADHKRRRGGEEEEDSISSPPAAKHNGLLFPEGVRDIDLLDENDPQWATTYVNDIFEHLRENERRHQPVNSNYMDTLQKSITPSMRAILIDWLVEVCEEYEISSETLYLATNFIDRFLAIQLVDKRKLQLVGVASLLIAAKYEEVYAPSVDEFVYISANTYSSEEVLLMEVLILTTLGFDLTAATAKVFLRRFLKAANADLPLAFLAGYITELTLQEYSFVKYLPSQIATAALHVALRILGREAWNPTLAFYTKYDIEDKALQQCIAELREVHKNAPSAAQQAVRSKYTEERFRGVAALEPTADQ